MKKTIVLTLLTLVLSSSHAILPGKLLGSSIAGAKEGMQQILNNPELKEDLRERLTLFLKERDERRDKQIADYKTDSCNNINKQLSKILGYQEGDYRFSQNYNIDVKDLGCKNLLQRLFKTDQSDKYDAHQQLFMNFARIDCEKVVIDEKEYLEAAKSVYMHHYMVEELGASRCHPLSRNPDIKLFREAAEKAVSDVEFRTSNLEDLNF